MLSFDSEFGKLVHAAAAGNGAGLAAWLRSERPLGEGERHMLAGFFEGKFKRRQGKPSSPKLSHSKWRQVAVEYLERTATDEKAEAVIANLEERFGVGRSTILEHVAKVRKQVARLDAMGLDGLAKMKSS